MTFLCIKIIIKLCLEEFTFRIHDLLVEITFKNTCPNSIFTQPTNKNEVPKNLLAWLHQLVLTVVFQ